MIRPSKTGWKGVPALLGDREIARRQALMIRRLIKRVEQLPDSLKSITGEPKPARYAPKRCYLRWDQDHIGLDFAPRGV